MDDLLEVNNVSVSIRRLPADVYSFVTNGQNVPRWASGLGTAIEPRDGEWIAEGPIGKVRLRFAEPNELGVADHDVTLETGVTVHNPIRVIPNGSGSTLFVHRSGAGRRGFRRQALRHEHHDGLAARSRRPAAFTAAS
jgi:hypothetical protein